MAGPDALLRTCKAKGCGVRHDRPRARYCPKCGAESSKRWRARNGEAIAGRRRATYAPRVGDAARIASARACVATYVKRGKLLRGTCVDCGRRDVTATWDDLDRPLEPTWRCRPHAADFRDRRSGARRAPAEEDALVEQLTRMTPAAQSRIRAAAAAVRGPGGVALPMKLDENSPLFRLQLIAMIRLELSRGG